MKVVPLRLQPGDDLRLALEAWMGEQQEQAGCLISAVGSLSLAQLRLAGATQTMAIHGELEILSLSGTLDLWTADRSDDSNARPSGGTRQINYRLVPGEARCQLGPVRSRDEPGS